MSTSIKLEGFKELDDALQALGKATTQKASLRRALRKAAEPMAEIASSNAPRGGTGTLATSVSVSTKLSPRQAKLHRKMFRNDKAAVEMFVGAGPLPSAHTQEFGTIHNGPQPFMRPAWDQDQKVMLERLKTEIASDIEKTVARANRKAARQAAKG